jgi:SAM-dependent methyltransferase
MVEVNYIVNEIKKKKELSGLDNSVVFKSLEKQIKKIDLTKLKKRELKALVKNIRAELRTVAGSFNLSRKSKELNFDYSSKSELLNLHASTKERISSYPEITKFIKGLEVKSILDIGCGLNPIALASKDYYYYASDINRENMDLIEKFFRHNNFKGETFIFDLRNSNLSELPRADLCIMFKVLDVIEERGHKLAEKIVQTLKCRYFLISFSTKTLSGKPMNHPQRGWIEQMLNRLGYSYKILKEKNEIIYFFEKTHPAKAL